MARRQSAVGPKRQVAKGPRAAPARELKYPERRRLGLRVSPDLHERLVAHCNALMVPASVWVSTQVAVAIAGEISATAAANFDDGPSVGRKMLTIRVLPSLLKSLEKVAATLSANAPEKVWVARAPHVPVSVNRLVAYIVATALKPRKIGERKR